MAAVTISITLTPSQIAKLKNAHKNKTCVTLRFKHNQLTLTGKHTVKITPLDFKKIMSAKNSKAKRGVEITFSHQQIGGFWGALFSALATTIIKGVSNVVQNKPFFAGDGMHQTHRKKKPQKKKPQGRGLFLPGMRDRRY